MSHAIKMAACLLAAAVLLPASAEARRRFGGSGLHSVPSTTSTGRSMMVIPAVGGRAAHAKPIEADEARRVPFPPATAQQPDPAQALLRLSADDGVKVWCRSEIVVGGFCMIN